MARNPAKGKRSKKPARTTKTKRTTKATVSYAVALEALKNANARHKPVGCGAIDIKALLEYLRKERLPLKKVCFVALNAPFMRRPPTPAV
jgi:hypothetical protein